MNNREKFYITTAIAYTSRKPHIGNTYEVILTDAIARFKRKLGYDVFFLTGTDEHGQKIQQAAEEAGVTPKEYVDGVTGEIKKIWDLMGASYDHFIRTTDESHEAVVKKIFKKLYDQGDIYKSEYEGLYCVPCESFFTQSQLVDGRCPDCGREVVPTKEEAYFFKMSKYQDRLMKHIEEHPEFIAPESRKNEMVNNFLKPGLQDLCVSRTTFDWGIPVEFDPGHVVYVWIDALTNYISALGYDPDGPSEQYKKYWPADVHIIGKDILRFHTIYWPIILMALGEPLPKQIFGHPWLLSGMDKMSKSRGNVMYADDLSELFGVDAIRYYVLSEMPFASDGTITYETIISRYNSDLANTLGNLVNRTVTMCDKYFGGVIPAPDCKGEFDDELIQTALDTAAGVKEKMDGLRVADALDLIMGLARRSNKYIDETAPWVLAKDEASKPRLGTVLYNLLESIRFIAVLLESFMPSTAQKIYEQLGGCDTTAESLDNFGAIQAGGHVGKAEVLFARLDEKKKLEEIAAFNAAKYPATKEAKKEEKKPEKKGATAPEQITIDDFAKLDLRVAKVVSAEKIEGADKLYQLMVDMGGETRQIVSGLAKHYKADELVGKNVIVIANLKPVKLRGVDSYGMILAASEGDTLKICTTDGDIAPGAQVR